MQLEPEEKEMLESLERGEWETVSNIKQVRKEAKQAATRYFRKGKEKRISIRVFSKDLEQLKEIAEAEGLPYQTLVTSILHKYTTGELKETPRELSLRDAPASK
ncbi:MAG TPA: antitoxin [Coxiellaceae bacterium]|nr:antitoxin [Coxiellaceae bacterium]